MKDGMGGARESTGGVLVLLSGGVDSAACAHFYKASGRTVEALFVDYGQAPAKAEAVAAHEISSLLGLQLGQVTVAGLPPFSSGKIRGRNAALVVLGAMHFPFSHGIISLGIHSGTFYEDCSPLFVEKMQEILDLYEGGRIRLDAPFLHWRKSDIYRYAVICSLPLKSTFSCELGPSRPCGRCASCRDREDLHAS